MVTLVAGDQCNFTHCESVATLVAGDQCDFPQPDRCVVSPSFSASVAVSGQFVVSHLVAAVFSADVPVSGSVSVLGAYPSIKDGDYRQPFVTPNRGEVRFKQPIVGRYE